MKFAALVERKEARDTIGIYYAGNDWKLVNKIEVDTFDLQDLKWINGDSAILIWDSPLESKILVYSVATCDVLTKYEPDVIGLGIKTVSFSPSMSLTAVGCFDSSIFLYNNITA